MVILDSAWKKRKAEPGFTLLQYNEVRCPMVSHCAWLSHAGPHNAPGHGDASQVHCVFTRAAALQVRCALVLRACCVHLLTRCARVHDNSCQELLAEACVVARVPYSKLVRQ